MNSFHPRSVLIFFLVILPGYLLSQVSQPQLQRSLGSFYNEDAFAFTKTVNKGYALASLSEGAGGFDIDTVYPSKKFIWIVKLDSGLNIQWQQQIHKGYFPELRDYLQATDILQTYDSGIIVTGTSSLNATAESNTWAIKFDKNGRFKWKQVMPFQGVLQQFSSIKEASDGSLFLSGFKNLSLAGEKNGWLVKLNTNGSVNWEKMLPHPLGKSVYFRTIDILEDNDIIVAGNYDTLNISGAVIRDIMIMRLDETGNIRWQNTYGTNSQDSLNDFLVIPDGFIFTASSKSLNGVIDFPTCSGTDCNPDAWIAKLDRSGVIQWSKTYGETGTDLPGNIIAVNNGYYVAGTTNSNINAFSANRGVNDIWFMELDQNGDLVNNHVFYGGPKNDMAMGILIDSANNKAAPMIFSTTESQVGGQVEGFHGYENITSRDVWMFKTGIFNTISGIVFYDLNRNDIKDAGEPYFKRGMIIAKGLTEEVAYINLYGSYKLKLEGTDYLLGFSLDDSAFDVKPAERSVQFAGFFNESVTDFIVQKRPGISDISVNAYPQNFVRPGFEAIYGIVLTSREGDPVNQRKLYFVKDKRCTFYSSTPAATSINGDTLFWNYTNLKYIDTFKYQVKLFVAEPPVVQIGDTLSYLIWAPHPDDVDSSDNKILLKQIVRGSYDPNDKYETHEGLMYHADAMNGEYLNYTVRFQNKGTDTAFNVSVRDTLDNNLNLSSLEITNASHAYNFSINNRIIQWNFPQIKLPDDKVNEPGSNGYISYRIKTNKGLTVGTVIKNTAAIYFDYNLPVLTNVENTILAELVPQNPFPVSLFSFKGQVFGNNNIRLEWSTASESNNKGFDVQRTNNLISWNTIGFVAGHGTSDVLQRYTLNDIGLKDGKYYYRLRQIDLDEKFSYSDVISLVINDHSGYSLGQNYPNPFNGFTNITYSIPKKSKVRITIYDLQGKVVRIITEKVSPAGLHTVQIKNADLNPGVYYCKMEADKFHAMRKMIVQ